MSKTVSKIIKVLSVIAAGCMLLGTDVNASDSAAIVETFTGDRNISVYVGDVDTTVENLSVQIATSEVKEVEIQMISELDMPMRTLVLLDNSLSISKDNRSKITEILQNLISDRLDKEEICLATFHEEINKLTGYTNDYGELKRALDDIEYQDQETYLTDVLYALLTAEYMNGRDDVYQRIIIISDGVDNKSLGYTKDEFYTLLKDIRIPIYAIGSLNGKNNEELENLFAISRMTSADYFLLDETEELLAITEELKKDRNIVKLIITPSAEMMDGSKKNVKIAFTETSVLATEMVMPQQAYVKEIEEISPQEEVKAVKEETPIVEEEKEEPDFPLLLIIGIVAAVTVIVVVIVLLVARKKKMRKQEEFEIFDPGILNDLSPNKGGAINETEIIGSLKNQQNDGSTVMIWNQEATYQVVLTDINSSAKSFQVPLNRTVVIGRKKGECDIVLDYEPSVSGRHCEISVKDGKFYVRDLQSSNHTYLNENKVLTETEIFPGNILKLGRAEVRFEVR